MYEGVLQDLIDELARLPGVGPKGAQRIAFHLLAADPDDVRRALRGVDEVCRGEARLDLAVGSRATAYGTREAAEVTARLAALQADMDRLRSQHDALRVRVRAVPEDGGPTRPSAQRSRPQRIYVSRVRAPDDRMERKWILKI